MNARDSRRAPLVFLAHWVLYHAFRLAGRFVKVRKTYELAILKPDRIGDMVLAVSTIRLLGNRVPRDQLLLVVSPHGAALLREEFPQADFIVVPCTGGPLKSLRFLLTNWKRLFEVRARALVCLRHDRNDFEENLLHWLKADETRALKDLVKASSHTSAKFGLQLTPYDRALQDFPETIGPYRYCRELDRHHTLLRSLPASWVSRIELCDLLPSLPSSSPLEQTVLICPFGSSVIRDLPLHSIETFLETIQFMEGFRIQLLGTEVDLPRLKGLQQQLSKSCDLPIEILSSLSFPEFIDRIRRAPLILTTETATSHLAHAMDKPCLTVLGGGHYGEFFPWCRSPSGRWVTNPLPCFHCNWTCKYDEPRCIQSIAAADIRAETEILLDSVQSILTADGCCP